VKSLDAAGRPRPGELTLGATYGNIRGFMRSRWLSLPLLAFCALISWRTARAATEAGAPTAVLGLEALGAPPQVVDDLTEITGFSGSIKWLTDRPEGQDRRMLDMSTTEKMLGFRCETTLHEGLEKTVNWYRANRKTARNLVATQFN